MNIYSKTQAKMNAWHFAHVQEERNWCKEAQQFRQRMQQIARHQASIYQPNAFEQALLLDGKIADKEYARHLYCAIENSVISDLEGNLVEEYGQRSCAWTIACLRNQPKECYLDFAWHNTNDDLTYIHEDLKRLGFVVGEYPLE